MERALRSVLAQTLPPAEIIVVDDGSTDDGAGIISTFCESRVAPEWGGGDKKSFSVSQIKLIRQPNAGVSAARNRAMSEAKGDFFALLDADDEWKPTFLEEMAALIAEFPDCGLYCSAYDVVGKKTIHTPSNMPERGVVDDFFRASMTRNIAIPSACVIPRRVVEAVGGFPEGMRLGEDQYMWIKIARRYGVCFSPEPLVRYHKAASNRSAAMYEPEKTAFSFEYFLAGDPQFDFWLREFVARAALGKALTVAARGGDARREEKIFGYNKHSRRLLWRLRILNRLPRSFRPMAHRLYDTLAWRLARKGL